ncbi:MAG: ABC-F family ATP-binding cassette domain-containing protein [Candidatus Eremiobacteraeota bacterium]|nr:ABC-F family ATP-binding cassette domain-containing protein [Candidatus Eremiobacteraeota bacterium]
MPIVTVEQVSKAFPNRPLFEGANFGLEWGEKVGLIGLNGSGKSTLLKIIAGQEPADAGQVVWARDIAVEYLSQEPEFPAGVSVLKAVFSGDNRVVGLLGEYQEACEALTRDASQMERVARLSDEIEAAGAWELETRARTVLTALGIDWFERPVAELSGGQRKLVALARALVGQPDLLLLDEPTNHLDLARIEWLENYLKGMQTTLVMVTHDRYFLELVVGRILEVEGGQVHDFAGNYGFYLEHKELREQHRVKAADREENHLRRELAWLRQGPKARSTRQKARHKRALELIDSPREAKGRELALALGMRRLGKKLLETQGLRARNLAPLDFELQPGERVGIVGPNGSGKTTFLELITGSLEPEGGQVELGSTVHIGYYRQQSEELDPGMKVIEAVREVAEVLPLADGRSLSAARLLEQFLFPPHTHYNLVEKLSGGERRRLELLRVLMDRPNLLILDEPTNDLDIDTLVRLETYLDDFAGCVILVSHDRYLLDRVSTRYLLFNEGRVEEYLGLVSELRPAVPAARPRPTPSPARAQASARPQKLSYKEAQELATLEQSIAEGEARQAELEGLLASSQDDFEKVHGWYAELETLRTRLEVEVERWAELAERQ